MTDLDIIKECRQTGRTRTTTKNLLEKAYQKQMTNETDISKVLSNAEFVCKDCCSKYGTYPVGYFSTWEGTCEVCGETTVKKGVTKEIDISKVLIEGDTATIMGEKYRRIIEPKSPVEEAYQKVYGGYPPTTPSVSNYEDNRWSAFQNGYNASQVIETPQEEPKEPQTLYDALDKLDKPMLVDDVYYVVKNWLPTKRVENKYDADYNSGWNDLLDTLRRTLR